MNGFSVTTHLVDELRVEYYTTRLDPPRAMFVKMDVKVKLVEKYEEANKVEADLDSIAKHTLEPDLKHTTGKRPLLLIKKKNTLMS